MAAAEYLAVVCAIPFLSINLFVSAAIHGFAVRTARYELERTFASSTSARLVPCLGIVIG